MFLLASLANHPNKVALTTKWTHPNRYGSNLNHQTKKKRRFQIHVSISMGNPFWGYPIFDNHSQVSGIRRTGSRVRLGAWSTTTSTTTASAKTGIRTCWSATCRTGARRLFSALPAVLGWAPPGFFWFWCQLFYRFFLGWEGSPTKNHYSNKLVPTYSNLSNLEDLDSVGVQMSQPLAP